MEKVKFAVIGLGHIGRRHATIINEFPNAQLVGLMDKNQEASKHELVPAKVPFYTDLEQMIKETDPDVINICTPNGSHTDYALECLQHKRHVVIEKPMGLSKAKAEEVIFKALQVSKQVFVVKQNRYSPPSKWLKEIVEEDKLGDIHMVQINCYWNRDDRYYKKGGWKGNLELDGGTLYTQFSHFIDIMYWVFGDITNIKANFADFNHHDLTDFEDSGVVNFNFVNGGVGCINFSTAVWDTNMESSITVVGSKGSIKIGGQYMNEIEYCHVDGMDIPELPPTNPPNDYGPFKGSAANHHYVIENVVNTLNGKDTITANALEGLKVVEIIERIYETRDLVEIKKKK
ncbi:Gfo/Idh/MocA family protein [Salibacter halophilus]|uniref:Gfo/Idh/MocA family oxidoreductase n=1 Tax=Salibacter halophilus TaxID=1803916 RepID=A0A6N6M162_9FLAO|nr:Gfo/Idh/MocA family oxidoreductase [Salibacter halophilus]KAB1062028.1 Gfo/Idh/MocA family oxidoreductase [Salibacter halophilus]